MAEIPCHKCGSSGRCPLCSGRGYVIPKLKCACAKLGKAGNCPMCQGVGKIKT